MRTILEQLSQIFKQPQNNLHIYKPIRYECNSNQYPSLTLFWSSFGTRYTCVVGSPTYDYQMLIKILYDKYMEESICLHISFCIKKLNFGEIFEHHFPPIILHLRSEANFLNLPRFWRPSIKLKSCDLHFSISLKLTFLPFFF